MELRYPLRFLLLTLLIVFFYECIKMIRWNKFLHHSTSLLSRKSMHRQQRENQIRNIEGSQEKDSFFYSLDLMIEHSNIKVMLPFMSTELYLCSTIFISILTCFLVRSITQYWVLGILSVILVFILAYLVIYILSGIAYKKLESSIISFMNLLENYSKTHDDIVEIMGKTHQYLEDPLRTYIRDFYYEASNDGDTVRAFYNLEIKIEHDKLKDIIRNIEICSSHEANYDEIIKDNRLSLTEYLALKEERRAIINNGRSEIILLLLASGVCIQLFSGLVSGLFGLLLSSIVGNVIVIYLIVVLVVCCWVMVSFDK